MDEILKVEEELTRVRSNIERMEGRMKYLRAKTDMSEISITIMESPDIVVAAPPGFFTKIEKTFAESWSSVVTAMEWLALMLTALVPWIPVLAIVISLVVYLPRWLGMAKEA